MFDYVFTSLKGYKPSFLKHDIIAGIMVAALTIPVAMGYATVAGLPSIYGLYASILPAIGYILIASSRELVYGIDAAASAITGSCLAAFGIAAGSQEAMTTVALLSLFSGIFLIIFALFKLGRFADYVSMPVMSGFMSGLALSIIFSQVPKVLGIQGSGDDFTENLVAIFSQWAAINPTSLLIGAITVALILLGRRFAKRVPVGLILMVVFTILCATLRLDTMGVSIVGTIPQGLPPISFPDIGSVGDLGPLLGSSFMIAIVIFASSLTPAQSFAAQNKYELKNNREIAAYGVSNLLASISGCSPTSASVSRTVVSQQFNGKTQMVTIVSAICIVLVVLFFSGLLYYMPQPVLGAIVFAALIGAVDVKMIVVLFRSSRSEAVIWLVSAAGVLLVGTLFGVVIGVFMSFVDVVMRITKPPQAYLGKIDGRDGFFDMKYRKDARPVPDVAIYRFSARLFFGNINIFKAGVLKAIELYHPKLLVIDSSGINSIDATAAEEMRKILSQLDHAGVDYCFAGQTKTLNRQFEGFGLDPLLADGHTQKTIKDALAAFTASPIHTDKAHDDIEGESK